MAPGPVQESPGSFHTGVTAKIPGNWTFEIRLAKLSNEKSYNPSGSELRSFSAAGRNRFDMFTGMGLVNFAGGIGAGQAELLLLRPAGRHRFLYTMAVILGRGVAGMDFRILTETQKGAIIDMLSTEQSPEFLLDRFTALFRWKFHLQPPEPTPDAEISRLQLPYHIPRAGSNLLYSPFEGLTGSDPTRMAGDRQARSESKTALLHLEGRLIGRNAVSEHPGVDLFQRLRCRPQLGFLQAVQRRIGDFVNIGQGGLVLLDVNQPCDEHLSGSRIL